jgi:hypothetical protein
VTTSNKLVIQSKAASNKMCVLPSLFLGPNCFKGSILKEKCRDTESATHKLTARGGKETIIAIHRHVQVTGIDALANPW